MARDCPARPNILQAVRAAFILNGTTLGTWCRENGVDPARAWRALQGKGGGKRVAQLPTIAAPAPLIDVMMSPEADRFAGARIEAERQQKQQPTAEERLRARLAAEDELLEKKYGQRRA